MRIVFFDLETRLWASDLDPEDNEHGWILLREGKGGASAIGLYDTLTNFCHTYDEHNAENCARHLEEADAVVSFRGKGFDIPVLEGLTQRKIKLKFHYDIYEEIYAANAFDGIIGRVGENTLEAVSRRNLGRGKIDKGSNAKLLLQRGHLGALFNYCLDDVRLTRDLFAKICEDGGLINAGGQFRSLTVPDYIASAMRSHTRVQ